LLIKPEDVDKWCNKLGVMDQAQGKQEGEAYMAALVVGNPG
jgi:hypothetical protein